MLVISVLVVAVVASLAMFQETLLPAWSEFAGNTETAFASGDLWVP
jgi:hypothetical protein